MTDLETMRAENVRMAEALKFYAEQMAWKVRTDPPTGCQFSVAKTDRGSVARKALAQSPKSQALMEVKRAKDAIVVAVQSIFETEWNSNLVPLEPLLDMLAEAKRKTGIA